MEPADAGPQNGDFSEVDFVNMVLCTETGANDFISRQADYRQQTQMEAIPPGFEDDIESIRRQTIEKMGSKENPRRFNVTVGEMRFRAFPLYPTENGKIWYAYRRIPPNPHHLAELNHNPLTLRKIREVMRRPGLIVVGGGFEEGKTTTCSSMLYDYQSEHRGFAITVEKPVEYLMSDSDSSRGLCLQIAADDFTETDWERVTADIRKAFPSIVMIGEIADPASAKAALKLASLGRPVISTIHGHSHSNVITNLVDLAQTAEMPNAERIVSSVLTAIVHQTLTKNFETGSIDPDVRIIATKSNADDTLRKAIASMAMTEIEDEAQKQHTEMYEEQHDA